VKDESVDILFQFFFYAVIFVYLIVNTIFCQQVFIILRYSLNIKILKFVGILSLQIFKNDSVDMRKSVLGREMYSPDLNKLFLKKIWSYLLDGRIKCWIKKKPFLLIVLFSTTRGW